MFISVAFLLVYSWAGFAHAEGRNLPWVTIVTRAQWWADESWKYTDRPEYQAMLSWQVHVFVSEAEEENRKEAVQKSAIARQYAATHFASDIRIDSSVNFENGNALWWPFEYRYAKSKIIVHHTVNDMSKIQKESDMLALLQSVYKYHAFSNGWGDVWYNFIISPGGVIYEWRAWGEWVVWAHASWNNQPSLGIALIGNFNVDKPTDAQLKALIGLITALTKKYNIDPESKTDWHRRSNDYPYVSTFQNYTVVWHKDVGPTECPGENLYALLPAIRDSVENNLKNVWYVFNTTVNSSISSTTQTTPPKTTRPSLPLPPNSQKAIIALPAVVAPVGKTYVLRTRTTNMWTTIPKCAAVDGDVTIVGCVYRNGQLSVSLKQRNNNLNPGTIQILAKSRTTEVHISVDVTWKDDSLPAVSVVQPASVSSFVPSTENTLLAQKKKLFALPAVSATVKIALPVSSSDALSLMQKQMRVLLYNASMQSSSWVFTCTGTCTISDSSFTTLQVSFTGGVLTIQKNGLVRKSSSLSLLTQSWSTITISDAKTQSVYGAYRGNIDMLIQSIKKLDGTYISQYAIINSLPMQLYLANIGEASDSEPLEKTKVLALLAKAYALYYVWGSSSHPSIPKWATYNSIDDPRFFQKYVGVKREKISKNRPIALEQTKDEYVVYNNILPILPYFHCSPGFTRSAKEKWWWTDTPYLQSVLDDATCTAFEGHGVGLSGQGATKKAKDGMKAEDIIMYYYPWVEVKTLTN